MPFGKHCVNEINDGTKPQILIGCVLGYHAPMVG